MFLEMQKIFYDRREKIVYEFKNVKLSLSKKEDMKTDSSDQQPDTSDTPKQTKFNDFLKLIKEEQTNIDMRLFKKYFPYRTPDKMAQVLYNSKSKAGNHSEVNLIFSGFDHISKKVEEMPKDVRTEQVKKMNILLVRFLILMNKINMEVI